MNPKIQLPDRRLFLGAWAASLWTVPGLFAEQLLLPTPRLTEGPFYPDELPLDRDNDLILLGDNVTPALGEITHLTGRVMTSHGSPLQDVTVEIWQCDACGLSPYGRQRAEEKAAGPELSRIWTV